MATTSLRPALMRWLRASKAGISSGFFTRQGRSNRPSAQRQTGHRSCLPTSIPRVMSKPSCPRASRSQSTSLTRVARYALLIMGMTSHRSGCEISTPSLGPPIEASPLLFFYSQLRLLGTDALTEAAFAAIEEHVEDRERCGAILERLARRRRAGPLVLP